MRRFVIASHHQMAFGLRDTLQFLTSRENITDISAYVDDERLEDQVERVMASFGAEDEIVILTDMLGGSVNQHFCSYMSERCHLISGVNLPCALSLVLQPEDVPLTKETIRGIVEEARTHLVYVNEHKSDTNEEDE